MTFWLLLAAVLMRPLPLTLTDVALVLDQVMVDVPGAVALVGLALIVALTDASVLTVNVAVCVTGPPTPWAVMV